MFFFWCFVTYPVLLRVYIWFCVLESFLEILRKPCGTRDQLPFKQLKYFLSRKFPIFLSKWVATLSSSSFHFSCHQGLYLVCQKRESSIIPQIISLLCHGSLFFHLSLLLVSKHSRRLCPLLVLSWMNDHLSFLNSSQDMRLFERD